MEEKNRSGLLQAILMGGGSGGGSSGGGVLVVGSDEDTGVFDKTWQEIHDAPLAVLYGYGDDYSSSIQIISTLKNGSSYEVYLLGQSSGSPAFFLAVADSASGYPVFQES